MNNCSPVEIYCDGNEKLGFGHISRSMALAKRLETMGIPVQLKGLSESSQKLLPATNHLDSQANLVVLDAPIGLDELIIASREKGQLTITLDWFGNVLPDVNIAIYRHRQSKSAHLEYIGFDYVIIRDQILSLQEPVFSGDVLNVVICLGGGDVLGQGHRTAEFFSDLGFNVTLIQGPFAKEKQQDSRYQVFVNPANFAELLASCDWAITNGGGCLFEALYYGKPALVLPQTEAEMKIATYAKQQSVVMGIGIDEFRHPDVNLLKDIAERAKRIVDGKGLERITTIITDRL